MLCIAQERVNDNDEGEAAYPLIHITCIALYQIHFFSIEEMPQNMVEWLLCWRKATFLLKTHVVQVQVQDKPVFPHDSHSFTLDTLSQCKTSNFSVSSYGLYVISSLHQPIPMYNVRSWDVRVLDDGVDDRFIAVQKDFLTKFCTKNSLLVSSFQISTPICLILSSSITSWLETNSIWNIDWLFCISSTEITVDSKIRTLRKEGFCNFLRKVLCSLVFCAICW
jgi:hypothetical protein